MRPEEAAEHRSSVVLVEDDEDMRNAFGEIIETVAPCRCVKLASVDELMAHRSDVLASRLVILDINLGARAPSGVDAYRWLEQQGFGGRIVFLTGHARSHPLVEEACRLKKTRVYTKPMDIHEIEALVRSAIDA
jgi:DNA-binding NtrC family response regulator